MISILAPIVLALAVGSDEESERELSEALGIWIGPIFDDDDLERLEREGWIFGGYTVTISRSDVTFLPPSEDGESDYEEEHEIEVDEEPVDTLQAAISYRDESWCEWSSSHPVNGDWITSQSNPNPYTGAFTTYDLSIRRQDGRPLSKAEIEYIDRQLQLGAFS